jgi:hypothetical protein
VLVRVAEAGGIPRLEPFATKGTIMRAHHVIIAAVAVILIGLGVKLIFFWAPPAEAKLLSVKSVSMDISERLGRACFGNAAAFGIESSGLNQTCEPSISLRNTVSIS